MMAAPSRETLQRIAIATGHQPATLEKVLRLLDLMQEINEEPLLSGRLALKGGTALNVFYLPLDRLSVDIDLNYVGALDRSRMLEERPEVEAALNRILSAGAYAVRRQPDEHAGGKWIAQHQSALGGGGTLEIDLNFMMREPLFGTSRLDSRTLGGVQARGVLALDIHELAAGKLVALLDRRAARDLFDTRRLLAMADLDWRKVKTAMIAIGATSRSDFRQASIERIGADPRELKQKLAICLPAQAFAEAGSAEAWIEETVAICRKGVAPLIDFSAQERDFLDGVNERGDIRADLLDGDAELRARIARMPMLAWKCQNVRNKSQ